MIIIHVMGGLGNQLYQYALYEKLKSLGKDVKLDLYVYKKAIGDEKEWRNLELDYFTSLQYDVCSMKERTLFLDDSMMLHNRLRRKLFGRKDRTVKEERAYMPEIYEMDDVYLYGYWNCEKYYESIIPLLQEKIIFPISGNRLNLECMDKMKNQNSVSIHIRRTDYLSVADGKRYMGICTEEYYKGAMDYIESRVENPVYYIFSDDIEYAKENFNKNNMYVVDWNSAKDSMYDMQLMSCCKYNICANSTFSMWGARLNAYKNKIMIRPLRQDNYETIEPTEVKYLWNNWVLIDNQGTII